METLFRLVLTRPPIKSDEATPNIRLAQGSTFQAALGKAQKDRDSREALKSVARSYSKSAAFVDDPKKLAIYAKLKALQSALDVLESKKLLSNADVTKVIEEAFGKTVINLIKSKELEEPIKDLKDSLIAIKFLPEEHTRDIELLTAQLRDLEVILRIATEKDFPGKGITLHRYRRRSVLLPSATELRSSLSTLERQKELENSRRENDEKIRKQADEMLARYKQLKNGIEELTNLGKDHFQNTPQKSLAGFMPPESLRPAAKFVQDMGQLEKLTELELNRLQAELGKGKELAKEGILKDARLDSRDLQSLALPSNGQLLRSGSMQFTPPALEEASFRLKSSAEKSLSAQTRNFLKEQQLTISELPLDQLVESLDHQAMALSMELDVLLGRPVQRSYKRMGNAMLITETPLASKWNDMVISGDILFTDYIIPFDNRVPHSHGHVVAAGVADLLVVKQQLVAYEGADIAHIENVLKGEKKEREHILRTETEQLIFQETEISRSDERELESTKRFEMSRESSATIQEDASIKAGLSVSGKYGPFVEFSVSAEGSYSKSKEEATKSAARFSQDVTERSARKVSERVLERSSLRVTNEVIETNRHALDNVGGSTNIAGVYQWVNKIYQAQMYNYGMRMMYDFMIPEPAAFIISTLQNVHASAITVQKPIPFTLRPNQISEANYHSWVHQYGASDVQAPPEIYRTKSLDFKAGNNNSNIDLNHSGQLQIDDGYQAIYGTVGYVVTIWEDSYIVDTLLGTRMHRFVNGNSSVWGTTLSDERDSIPFGLITKDVGVIAIAVEVKCKRTERAMEKWRLDTHAKLTQAYKARLAEYEEKLAALQMQAGVAITGKNPLLNRELMNDELKKHCISILTEQHFDLFNAISNGAYNIPQTNLYENAAEGPYVRFFEQAFEWEQMTWLTYPYFWGRKHQWDERIAYEDVDPLFNQFLKAGYCRVSLPVRPGFEGAIDHFMSFGEIWNGGPLPAISNPLYLPIADEIAERLDRPGEEIPQGEPWRVRIPTSLVHLRADDALPRWQQNANGEWLEVTPGDD